MALSRKQKRQEKRRMYGEQKGRCAHCERPFTSIRDLELDHIVPTSKGGPDIPENLQLLCSYHNRKKSDLSDDYARARVEEEAKEDPDSVDREDTASTYMLSVRKSDDGHCVLFDRICPVQPDEPCGYPNPKIPPTNACRSSARPFDPVIRIDGRHSICEVRCFAAVPRLDMRFGKRERETYRFYGLALPDDIFADDMSRHARVKIEYSLSVPVDKGLVSRDGGYFYWSREAQRSVLEGGVFHTEAHCDLIRRWASPARNVKFYPNPK